MNFILSLFLVLMISCSGHAKYDRKEWKHWSDENFNCLDTRQEILKERSLSPVVFNSKGCKIKSGEWKDYYYPERLFSAKEIDLDHLVPLKEAHQSGGASWPSKKKEIFANDPENLVITNKKYNRSKGSKGPDRWLPVHKDFACKYVRDWIRVKLKYHLTFSANERRTIEDLRPSCKISFDI